MLCSSTVSGLKWDKIQPTGDIPTNITGAVFISKGRYAYLITGHVELWLESGTDITFTNDIYRLNTNTYVWDKLCHTYAPSPRAYASGVIHDNHIYIYGGTTFDNSYSNIQLQDDLWEYSISRNEWSLLSSGEGPETRTGSALFTKERELYLFGGIYDLLFGALPLYNNDLWKYDIRDEEWELQGPYGDVPSPRQVPQQFQRGKNLYINSGEYMNPETFEFISPGDTLRYDVNRNQWYNITPSINPTPRNYAVSASVRNDWYIYGGELDGEQVSGCNAPFGQNVGSDLWVFDDDVWTELHPSGVIPPLKRAMGVERRGSLLVVSGFDFVCDNGVGPGQVYNNAIYILDSR
jgi:N-acetylneuraminic acid mutarotase